MVLMKLRLTERLGGFFRPRIHEEVSLGAYLPDVRY